MIKQVALRDVIEALGGDWDFFASEVATPLNGPSKDYCKRYKSGDRGAAFQLLKGLAKHGIWGEDAVALFLTEAETTGCSGLYLDHPNDWAGPANTVIGNTEIGYLASLMTPPDARVISFGSGYGTDVMAAVKLGKSHGVCVDRDSRKLATARRLASSVGIDEKRIRYEPKKFQRYVESAELTPEDTCLALCPHKIEDEMEGYLERTPSQYLLLHCNCDPGRIKKHKGSAKRLGSGPHTVYSTFIQNEVKGRYPVLIRLRDSAVF